MIPQIPRMPVCAVDGCEKRSRAVGGRRWCSMHQERWRLTGSLALERKSNMERFLEKIDDSAGPDGCHLWVGYTDPNGYGRFRVDGESSLATRWLLGKLRGEPLRSDEYALHHCDNPPCCNERHLYVGSQKQNMQDAVERGRINPWNRGKTSCIRGHPLEGDNLYLHSDGRRGCRRCRHAASTRHRKRDHATT